MDEPSAELLALHPIAKLKAITYLRLHSERIETFVVPDELPPIDPTYQLRFDTADDGEFRLRVTIEIETPHASILVEAAAEYVASEYSGELTPDLLVEYTNQIGTMTLLPYLRQAVADLTQRVFGEPLLMPVMERGAIVFDASEAIQVSG